MTNAHVIADSTELFVRLSDDSTKYPCIRKFVDHDCDLALLEINSEKFLKTIKPEIHYLNFSRYQVG